MKPSSRVLRAPILDSMPAPLTATRRRRPAPVTSLLTAAVLLGVGLLAGCSGDEPASDSTEATSESPSESASASPTESASEGTAEAEGAADDSEEEPALPKAPKARNTPDGRKAFTEFVVERWGYALATNEASAVTDLSAKGSSCQGCKELEKELEKRSKQEWAVDFPGATVDKITVKAAGAPATFESTAVIDIPASRSYFEDGTYRNENEAFKNAEFVVGMKYTEARYVLLSYRVA
jgi:hypothetical protein